MLKSVLSAIRSILDSRRLLRLADVLTSSIVNMASRNKMTKRQVGVMNNLNLIFTIYDKDVRA